MNPSPFGSSLFHVDEAETDVYEAMTDILRMFRRPDVYKAKTEPKFLTS